MLFAVLVSVTLLRHHPLVREDDHAQREAAKVWLEEQKLAKLDKKEKSDLEGSAIDIEK